MSHPSETTQTTGVKRRHWQIPHIYVILFVFIAIAAVATYFVPAGEFERIPGPDGRTTIDAESFQYVASNPTGIVDFMLAIPNGLMSAGEVVFFTFMIGGMFMVLRRTGIIEIGVDKLSRRFADRSLLMIPVLMTVFAAVATIIGTQELALVYVPVILPLMIALRFDSVTAAAVALCATTAGFTTGILNPINTGLGQKLSDLPLYSGFGLRATAFVVVLGAAIYFVMRYARRIQSSPELSLMDGDESEAEKRALYQHASDEGALLANGRQKLAAIATFAFFGVLVYGVLRQGWFMMEMAGLFIVMGIVVGLIAGLTTESICEAFNKGFRDVLVGAMIAGVARGVAVVLEDGQIMDTLVYGLGHLVGELPTLLSAIGMYFAQLAFNFVVPSGSGQALVTMPIMAPLANFAGVPEYLVVTAYQTGNGLINLITPTSAVVMGGLAIARVGYGTWLRFVWPMLLVLAIISMVVLSAGVLIQ